MTGRKILADGMKLATVGTLLVLALQGCRTAPDATTQDVLLDSTAWSRPKASEDVMAGHRFFSVRSAFMAQEGRAKPGLVRLAVSVGCGVISSGARDHMTVTLLIGGARTSVGHINAEGMFENTARVQWNNDTKSIGRIHLIPLGGAAVQLLEGIGQILVLRGDETAAFVRQLISRDFLRIEFGMGGTRFLFDLSEARKAVESVTRICREG